MPWEMTVHGEQMEDPKLAKKVIDKAPEAVKLTYGRISADDPKDGFCGDLRRAPSGIYTIMGPPRSTGRWSFQMVVKNGGSGTAKFIVA